MITILIISNLILLGALLLVLRNSRRKSLLLKASYQWKESFVGYEYTDHKCNRYSLAEAAKKQKLINEYVSPAVPQPVVKKYIPESWKQE